MEETASDISFFVRTIHFQGKRASYCLQNFNGPCPLLALANVLLLRAKLYIKPGVDRLKTSHLLTVIGDAMLEQGHDLDDETLSRLAGLTDGLQINVGFSSCTSFEPSTGLGVFAKLNIRRGDCYSNTCKTNDGPGSHRYIHRLRCLSAKVNSSLFDFRAASG